MVLFIVDFASGATPGFSVSPNSTIPLIVGKFNSFTT
jgi:hypothetical protein